MKIGQQVHLTFDPEATGTVTAVQAGKFRVTWHDDERKSGQRRNRIWYGPEALMTVRPA